MLLQQIHKHFIRFAAVVLTLVCIWPAMALAAPKSTAPAPTCVQKTSKVDCAAVAGNCTTVAKCDLISKYVNPAINLLSALAGVAITISIIVAGIRYSSASGDPQKSAAAKHRIASTVIALIAFILLYAALNFLIPGGLI